GFLLPEFSKMTYPYWELQYALLCRCCVWAAGKEMGTAISAAPPVKYELTLPRGGVASSVIFLPFILTTTRERGPLHLGLRMLDRFGKNALPWANKEVVSPPPIFRLKMNGKDEIPFPECLPVGRNLCILQLLNDNGQIVSWAATTIDVDSPLALEGVVIEPRVLRPKENSRDSLAPWDPESPLRATIKVRANPKPQGKTTLTCELVDTHERLLGKQTLEVEAGKTEYPVEFPLRDLVNSGLELRCQLMYEGALVDSASARAIAPRPRVWKPLQFTSWGGVFYWRSEYLEKELGKLVDDLGVDVAFEGGTELQNRRDISNYWNNIAFSELDILRYGSKDVLGFPDEKFAEKSTGYQKTKEKKFLAREPCLNDPVWREKIRARIQEDVKKAQEVGWAHDYCMGDEMSLTYYTTYHDYCWSDYCLTKFRETLKAKYGTLEKLNAGWETQFADWNAVVPMTLAEVKNRPNAAPWAEHRQFMDTTLQEFFQFVQKAIREVDPQARCGLSGTQAPEAGNGMDWWKMCSAFNFDHTYNTGCSEEMRRSFALATGLEWSPYYAGYWQHGRRLEYNLFACLLHDTTGISAWYTPLFFYGDMTFSECGKDTRDLLAELKTGIWDQFRAVKRQHEGIAVLYSHPSIEAALLLGKEEAISAHRSAWVWMLEDLGLQYSFVSYEQLAKGELSKGAYRVLVLPMAMALSPGEVKAVRDFAANGGTVIADAYCGLMDDVCRRKITGLLDDLFGIKRPQELGKPTQPGALLNASLRVKDNSAKLCIAEPGLAATAAKALATGESDNKPPALFTRKVGKGNTWYLNLDLSQYETERKFKSATERAIHQILLASLASANVRPRFGLSYESGATPHVEVVCYGAGGTEYVGFLREYSHSEKDEILNVRLPSPRNVTDIRLHRDLGKVTCLRIPIATGECRLYSLDAKPLSAPTMKVLTANPKPGQRLDYEVQVPGASSAQPRVVHVTVTKPNGASPRDYQRSYTLTGKPVRGFVPLALNDEVGEWKIDVRDVSSGKMAVNRFGISALVQH
ncbi:MAG: beta-galactosidase trimerization domain-containing protein, partial [Armatimonadetes bacterium]|nr:beta-galactosidase trimerization domain-containing protein [Armatimonadota bacterium]